MSVHYQFGLGYGTSVQIAGYTGIAYEPVYDTSNQRLVIMLGTGAGNLVALATENYVLTQIGGLQAGQTSNLLNWMTCT